MHNYPHFKMLTISTREGGTTQGVELRLQRGAGLQREQSTASTPGQDTRIKGKLRKNFSACQCQDSSGKALHMAIENTMRELLCIQKQEVFWGQIHSTVL